MKAAGVETRQRRGRSGANRRKSRRLLLLYPGVLFAPFWGNAAEENTHLVYCHAFLRRFFEEVTVLDLEAEYGRPGTEEERKAFLDRSLERILFAKPDLVAVSCWSSLNYLAAVRLAEGIRRELPAVRILVGGYHPTFQEADFRYPGSPFDFVASGEIERAAAFLGVDLPVGTAAGPWAAKPEFASYPYARRGGMTGVFLSTGCPYKCAYCMEYRRRWTAVPGPEALKILAEIEQELAPQAIMILDACFGRDPGWRKDFLKGLAGQRPRCGFWIQTRSDLLDDDDLDRLARLSVRIDLGVESFSPTMLRIMRKTPDPARYLERFVSLSRKCSALGIEHDAYLIFNHPGESEKTVREHERFVERRVLPELAGGTLTIRVGTFSLFPGSAVYRDLPVLAKRFGTTAEHPQWWKEEGDHLALSRSVIPSRDDRGRPFVLSPRRIAGPIAELNRSFRGARGSPSRS